MVAHIGKKDKNIAKGFPKQKRKWYFSPTTHSLTTEYEGVPSELAIHGQPKNFAYGELAPSALLEG